MKTSIDLTLARSEVEATSEVDVRNSLFTLRGPVVATNSLGGETFDF